MKLVDRSLTPNRDRMGAKVCLQVSVKSWLATRPRLSTVQVRELGAFRAEACRSAHPGHCR